MVLKASNHLKSFLHSTALPLLQKETSVHAICKSFLSIVQCADHNCLLYIKEKMLPLSF